MVRFANISSNVDDEYLRKYVADLVVVASGVCLNAGQDGAAAKPLKVSVFSYGKLDTFPTVLRYLQN